MKFVSDFPNIRTLMRRMQSLAALDAVLSPEWEYRYYSFDGDWAADEMMGSIRNGEGDEVFALFDTNGCFIKEFSHEYQTDDTASSLYAVVPAVFEGSIKEPAFSPEYVTTCYWREHGTSSWASSGGNGTINHDANLLLATVDGRVETFQSYASDYHEFEISAESIDHFFQHHALTPSIAKRLGYKGDFDDLALDLQQIRYPFSKD